MVRFANFAREKRKRRFDYVVQHDEGNGTIDR